MNVAYFSTVETTISSSSYSLLTSSGRLLMIYISFLLVSYLLPWTRAKRLVKGTRIRFPGLERPHDSFGSRKPPKVGSLHPNPNFARAQTECRAMRILIAPQHFRSPQR